MTGVTANPASPLRRMTNGRLFLFCLPAVVLSLTVYPLTVVLPAHYNSHQGVPLATIGLILFASRIFDGAIDPAIGFLSDLTRGPLGARKPWILVGALVVMVAVYFLFMPGPKAGAIYFTVWSMAAYLGWSLIQIPYLSWSAEISLDYAERTRIFTYQRILAVFGPVAFLVIPLLPFLHIPVLDQRALTIAAWVSICATPLFIGLAVMFVPDTAILTSKRPTFRSLLSTITANRPFQRFIAVASLGHLMRGIGDTLFFIFMADYLGLAKEFSWIAMAQLVIIVVAMRGWMPIINKIGKHRAWAWSKGLGSLATLLFFFVKPGAAPPLMVVSVLCVVAIVGAAQVTIGGTLLGDVIDYDTLKTGTNKAGNYYAVLGVIEKLGVAAGGGLGFMILGLFGYKVGTPHDQLANFGMLFVFVVIPAIAAAISIPLLWTFPIDKRRHGIIARRLALRAARLARAASPGAGDPIMPATAVAEQVA